MGQLLAIFLTAWLAGGANAPASTGHAVDGALCLAAKAQANAGSTGMLYASPGQSLSVLGSRPVFVPADLSVDKLPASIAGPPGSLAWEIGFIDPPGDSAARPTGRSAGMMQPRLAAQDGPGVARGRHAPSALGSTAPPGRFVACWLASQRR